MPVFVIKIILPTNCANAMLLHQAPTDLLSMFVRHKTPTILKSYLSPIPTFLPYLKSPILVKPQKQRTRKQVLLAILVIHQT